VSTLGLQLLDLAARTGRAVADLAWQHVLDGLLRRVSATAHAGELVLRGGLRTRMLVAPATRPTQDADFLALFDRDLDETARRVAEVLRAVVGDGVTFDPEAVRGSVIWEETQWAGVRLFVHARGEGVDRDLQIDVGFGDPVVPAPEWADYPTLLPGPPARVLTCRAETLTGWKLHGLFEHGLRRWRPKDLQDLLLLTTHAPLDMDALADAIRVAFTSRGDPLEGNLEVLYTPEWWSQEKNRAKWEMFRPGAGGQDDPGDLLAVAAEVTRRLRPAVGRLVRLPPDERAEPGRDGSP
jgi:hypothetical protein